MDRSLLAYHYALRALYCHRPGIIMYALLCRRARSSCRSMKTKLRRTCSSRYLACALNKASARVVSCVLIHYPRVLPRAGA